MSGLTGANYEEFWNELKTWIMEQKEILEKIINTHSILVGRTETSERAKHVLNTLNKVSDHIIYLEEEVFTNELSEG